jgi:DNA modification methylase
MTLIHGDCLIEMQKIKDESIDLLFCDLPYNQTSCAWDCAIDLVLFWKEVNRICKVTTPMFFTCSTKFGVSLINSNPKNFRYDMVWVKSASCGFLNAKKMPMKKHEMLYVFYRKLPLYDLSSHKHKFLKEKPSKKDHEIKYDPSLTSVITTELYSQNGEARELYRNEAGQYDPPLPTTILRQSNDAECYDGNISYNYKDRNEPLYIPSLPTTIINQTTDIFLSEHNTAYGNNIHFHQPEQRNGESIYDPPLPNSILEIKSEKSLHPTQKPTALIEWCLKYYSKEGDTILDPTAGSGSTGVACKKMNRKFIGIEKDTEYFKVMEKRLA